MAPEFEYSTMPEVVTATTAPSRRSYRPPPPPKPAHLAKNAYTSKVEYSRTKTSPECCVCTRLVRTWKCVQCDDFFCDDCWPKQRPHMKGKVGIDGRQHEKVDEEVISRLQHVFGQPTKEEQHQRHGNDINTTWFGVDKEANQPFLHYSNRLVDILQEGQVEQYSERYPQLVSIVGPAGAGKSTVIKMLINQQQSRTGDKNFYSAPVPGLVGDNIPTTGDVHLYADPGTCSAQRPILYADCEGMTGGENAPRGLTCREMIESSKKGKLVKNRLRVKLKWADNPNMQSREYAVRTLFPRILYTFSDVVVFVLREVRTFQTDVLQQLVNWAAISIDKSINQPSLPHLIIVLNATDSSIDERQWDPNAATRDLLVDYQDSVQQVPALRDIIVRLEALGKRINNTKELLEYYYSSVTVLRIPSKGRYMQIDEQVGKLYHHIGLNCARSHEQKRRIRMLLNAERLPQYVNSAYEHFSRRLNEPFNFQETARLYAPLPRGFGGHVLNLVLSMYNQDNRLMSSRPEALFTKLSPLIATCIMLAATRDGTQGTYSSMLWSFYHDPLYAFMVEFCDNWLCCSYKQDGFHCCNAMTSHAKGHQAQSGKIFARGQYESSFDSAAFFPNWIKQIDGHIAQLNARLQSEVDGEERDHIHRMHREVIGDFYRDATSLPMSTFRSHLTCLCCMRKIPENLLPCGHILCKECVQAFGKNMGQGLFEMSYCPLHPNETHWSQGVRIRFKPEEAGVRVLCMDGGGIRGIVELTILKAIEDELGGNIPVQNFFDLIVGTSTGGIIALGLGVKRWSVYECRTLFKTLCKEAFSPRPFKKLAIVSHKSYYKTRPFEVALRSAFDDTSLLYGGSKSSSSTAIRVAVTSTSATDNRPVILSNYNTEGGRDHVPYDFVRPRDPDSELKVWEAARATSAAPPYFKTFVKGKTMAAYADGAIHHNCPAVVAESERKLLWEEVSDWPPDLFLSLGTGLSTLHGESTSGIHSSKAGRPSRTIDLTRKPSKIGGLGYMWRAANTIIDDQLNSEKIWENYYAKVTSSGSAHGSRDKRRNVRINIELEGHRPGLDNVNALDDLERQAAHKIRNLPDIVEVAHRLVASCFYFEKIASFFVDRGEGAYECMGNIRCRFVEGSSDLKGLGRILRKYTRGTTFAPCFYLEENYNSRDQRNHEVPIPNPVVQNMCDLGLFQMQSSIIINGSRQSSLTRLSLCLQPEPYEKGYEYDTSRGAISFAPLLSISGFPRELCAQDSPLSPMVNEGDESEEKQVKPEQRPASAEARLVADSETQAPKLHHKRTGLFRRWPGHSVSTGDLESPTTHRLSIPDGDSGTETNSMELPRSASSLQVHWGGELADLTPRTTTPH